MTNTITSNNEQQSGMKFEHTADIGDVIKSYDFQPISNRDDSYIIGRVVDKGWIKAAYQRYTGYTVEVLQRVRLGEVVDVEPNERCYTPFESFFDFDERITKVTDQAKSIPWENREKMDKVYAHVEQLKRDNPFLYKWSEDSGKVTCRLDEFSIADLRHVVEVARCVLADAEGILRGKLNEVEQLGKLNEDEDS